MTLKMSTEEAFSIRSCDQYNSHPSPTYLDLRQVPPNLLQHCPNIKYLSLSNADGGTLFSSARQCFQGNTKERKRLYLESLRVEHMDFSEDNWIVDNSMLDRRGIKKLHTYAETCFDIGPLINCFASSLEELVFYDDRGRRASDVGESDDDKLDSNLELREVLHEILCNEVDFRVSTSKLRSEFPLAPFSTSLDLD